VSKRLIFIVALLFSAARADALEYTDVYYNPAESGWGVFLVQSDVTQFLAFFIYATDNKPTWYTAQLAGDSTGKYTGQLYATTGSYFGSTWNPGQLTVAPVGTATFTPTDAYRATLTYALTGGPTVTKTVQRQTLTPYKMAGIYSGSVSGTQTGCADAANNDDHLRARYDLGVAQLGDTAATLTISFVDAENKGLVCTVQGPLTHFGRLYRMPAAQFSCTGPGAPPGPTTVQVDSLHPTGQGIEFHLSGPIGGGCILDTSWSAVLNN
jgi:hypothetical protein